MMSQSVFKSSCICFLFFSVGACAPPRKSQSDAAYYYGGSGYTRGGSGFTLGGAFSAVGAGSNVGSSAAQDAGISQIANLMSLSPYGSRPLLHFHWNAPQVPQGMVATRPVYPSSLIVHTDSGYQRARDFRSDSKYTKDAFDNIPLPGTPQNPGSGSKGHQKS